MIQNRRMQQLSWLTTLSCCIYVEWMAYRFGTQVEAARSLLSLGGKLDLTTRLVLHLSPGYLLLCATVAVAVLVFKEFLAESIAVRLIITLMVFGGTAGFFWFCLDALFRQVVAILKLIG